MLKYFHEHFPKENYSIWLGKYMYNDELTLDFLANNLIKGMFQRLEKLRKHAFGCVCLLKTPDGKCEKLDYDAASTKQIVDAFWVGDGQWQGKEIEKHNVYKQTERSPDDDFPSLTQFTQMTI